MLLAARNFGIRRFCDQDSNMVQQCCRMNHLLTRACNEQFRGIGLAGFWFWHVVQGRSRIQPAGAAGVEENPLDIFRELSFITLFHVYRLFCKRAHWQIQRFLGCFMSIRCFSKVFNFIGKSIQSVLTCFEDLRWIGKFPVLQRWYMRSLQRSDNACNLLSLNTRTVSARFSLLLTL